MFWERLQLTLGMIKFEHSVFALPFALTGALLAWRMQGFPRDGAVEKLVWIVIAMITARSAAMAFNRLLDAEIDGANPRTKGREIPAGKLSKRFTWAFLFAMSFAFIFAAGALGRLCFYLALPALMILFFYSFTKRFTHYSHLVLGFALGVAPAAAWIAVTGALDPRILWLTAAVTFWTAGFDIIYACQDVDFDRSAGLYSLPKRFGVSRALTISRGLHGLMLSCLVLLVIGFGLGRLSWAAVVGVAALLVYEHSLVKPHDLSRVNAAFFTVNGYVSVLFFAFLAADVWWSVNL